MDIKVFNLADKLEYVDLIVDQINGEWGLKEGKGNRNYWESMVKSSLNRDRCPSTFIALLNEKFVGTFSLWRCDLLSRQDIEIWLAALLVSKEHRNCGIGKFLQDEACLIAKQMGYKQLHLLSNHNNYYEKNGWTQEGESPMQDGNMVKIYKKSI